MPIFEYRCAECETRFERIVFGRPETIECPTCRSTETEKLISSFAVSGTGSGSMPLEEGPCPCGAPRRGMCGES
ncbi:MAG: zinc ribbon domain-containing protein [Acidobacteriota bacterium]